MTTMVAWLALNLGEPNAVYLASDSRITWGTARRRWDAGRKLFTCRRSADIFGYCGDALFPTQVLGQIAELADNGLLFNPLTRSEKRHAAAVAVIQASHARRHNAPDTGFEILHITRQGEGKRAEFQAWVTRYSGASRGWEDRSVELTASTPLVFGSLAAKLAEKIGSRLPAGEQETNAIVFSTFCDGLEKQSDARSGGVPQLVGLFADREAQVFGIVHDGERFFHGLPAGPIHSGRLQWRDKNFTAIDGSTLKPRRLVRRQDRARTRRDIRGSRGDRF